MKLLLVFFTTICLAVLPGCALFQSACAKALPVLSAGQSYSTEAQQALEQVQRILDGMPNITPDKRKIMQDGIDGTRKALRAADALLAVSADTCSQPDILTIFKEFNTAWSILKGLFGANAGPGLLGAAPGSATGIVDPAIYRKAGGT